MKILLLTLLTVSTVAFGQDDYKIEINGVSQDISLDKEYVLPINGKNVTIKVLAKDVVVYKDELFSFDHSKDYKISKTKIEGGIEQLMLMTAEGSGILIQKYETIDPTGLNNLMISEITKESINYGFKMDRQVITKELKSGQKIKVDKAVLTYKDEVNIYEVMSIGKKDEGIVVVTMIMDKTQSAQGEKIIDLMWKTLAFNSK